jgi:hypothetical protein
MKFDDAKPRVGKDSVRLDDIINIVKFPKKAWLNVRLLDLDIMPMKQHWVNIVAGKDRREISIPKICISFDPQTEGNRKGIICPYCELEGKRDDFKYLANAIMREEQEDKPRKAKDPSKSERKSGFKDPNSDSWTPVSVIRLPSSLAKKIQDLKALNKKKNKETGENKTYSVSHEKFGCDIGIKFDPDAKGGDMYQVQLLERTPLTDEEKEFLVYELQEKLLDECGREDETSAKRELAKMEIVGQEKLEEEDEPKKKKKKSRDEDEDDDIDLEDEPKKKKKKSRDEDEDDDIDLEDEPKKKKKKSRDEDEDDDLDEEDEKPKKKKKSRDEDEDDDIPF